MPSIRLYDYVASANCYKVRLLLAQLGVDYERVPVDIFAGETLTEQFRRVNPVRTTPVLDAGDGRYLRESNAILMYLAEGSRYLPEDRLERAQVIGWLIFEQTDVVATMGGLRFRLLTGRLTPQDDEAKRRRDDALTTLGVLEEHLRGREFFVGDDYSVADIGLYGYVHVGGQAALDFRPYPNILRWMDRVAAQPAYMNDLEPYPPNARPGTGQSIYG